MVTIEMTDEEIKETTLFKEYKKISPRLHDEHLIKILRDYYTKCLSYFNADTL